MLYWCMNYLPSLQLFEHLHLLLAIPSDVSSRTSTCKCADSNNPPKSRPTKAPSSIFGTKAPWFSQLTKVKCWESESSTFWDYIYIHRIWFLSFNVIYLAHILPVPWKKWRLDTKFNVLKMNRRIKYNEGNNDRTVSIQLALHWHFSRDRIVPRNPLESLSRPRPWRVEDKHTFSQTGQVCFGGQVWIWFVHPNFTPLTIRNATYVNLII